MCHYLFSYFSERFTFSSYFLDLYFIVVHWVLYHLLPVCICATFYLLNSSKSLLTLIFTRIAFSVQCESIKPILIILYQCRQQAFNTRPINISSLALTRGVNELPNSATVCQIKSRTQLCFFVYGCGQPVRWYLHD